MTAPRAWDLDSQGVLLRKGRSWRGHPFLQFGMAHWFAKVYVTEEYWHGVRFGEAFRVRTQGWHIHSVYRVGGLDWAA